MTQADWAVIIILGLVGFIIIYFIFGCMGKRDYELHGWFFGFARFTRKFLCGMFVGHEYENGKCVHCFKKEGRQ